MTEAAGFRQFSQFIWSTRDAQHGCHVTGDGYGLPMSATEYPETNFFYLGIRNFQKRFSLFGHFFDKSETIFDLRILP